MTRGMEVVMMIGENESGTGSLGGLGERLCDGGGRGWGVRGAAEISTRLGAWQT